MSIKRTVLETLGRERLLVIADAEGVDLPERRALDPIRGALAAKRSLSLEAVLGHLNREELKAACGALGLDQGGREKDVLKQRLLDHAAPQKAEANEDEKLPLFAKTEADEDSDEDEEPAKEEVEAPNRRARTKRGENGGEDTRGDLGFEDKLWKAADTLRGHMDPSEYKHVVLGLLFLKYVSDAFEERRAELTRATADPKSDDYIEDEDERATELEELLEDRDEYTAQNVFWVPKDARWSKIQAEAKQPTIGKTIDDAMDAIEQENPRLRRVLPKVYALPSLDKHRLGKLIDVVSGIGLGTKEHQAKDTLGRVYEYFIGRFAGAEGKGGGEFFTPNCVVQLLVEMLEPYKGRVFDPCFGSGGMFVQSVKFIQAHGGQRDQVAIYGQESNSTTWKLGNMNLAIRGISANLGGKNADSFHEDLHPDVRADFILANPPFNTSDWGGERLREDVRWKHGVPPVANANFAWVQHFLHHLAPAGIAGFVLANGSLSSTQSGEDDIRRKLVEADLVDCVVALPSQLFYSTGIAACLWFLAKDRANRRYRDRRGETLFIDARDMGRLDTRVHRVLDTPDIDRVATTYHSWRNKDGSYGDLPGFCKAVKLKDIEAHGFVLTPGRYVGTAEIDETGMEPFGMRMERLVGVLATQIAKARVLDSAIAEGLQQVGWKLP